jgi:hypothetical protein
MLAVVASLAAASFAQTPSTKTPSAPVLIGSGSGTYNFKNGASADYNRTIIKLKVTDFLLGQVVIKLKIGTQCGASTGFFKEDKSVFNGSSYINGGTSFEFRDSLGQFKKTITKTSVAYEVNVMVAYGGVRFMAPPCTNSYSYSAQMENYQRYVPPKPYPGQLAASDYYAYRHQECIGRHPGVGAPSYYKGFGEKYYNRFMNDVYPKLTPKGQKFLTDTSKRLEEAIEKKLKDGPVEFAFLELNSLTFLRFAFGTHVDAYCDSGWASLDKDDRSKIRAAVDKFDLIMDRSDKATFGGIWFGIINALQVNYCIR